MEETEGRHQTSAKRQSKIVKKTERTAALAEGDVGLPIRKFRRGDTARGAEEKGKEGGKGEVPRTAGVLRKKSGE